MATLLIFFSTWKLCTSAILYHNNDPYKGDIFMRDKWGFPRFLVGRHYSALRQKYRLQITAKKILILR